MASAARGRRGHPGGHRRRGRRLPLGLAEHGPAHAGVRSGVRGVSSGVRHAVAVSSGTAALHLMYAACELGPGRRGRGAVHDVRGDRRTAPAPGRRARLRRHRRRARAVAVSRRRRGGHRPRDEGDRAHALRRPSRRARGAPTRSRTGAGVLLLQDAAHAIGATVGDRHVGAIGHAAAFSFFSNKNLAIGEGGMVATDDDDVAERVRRLRSHGMATLSWDRQRGRAAGYDIERLGFNYRLDDPRAALGTRAAGAARRGERQAGGPRRGVPRRARAGWSPARCRSAEGDDLGAPPLHDPRARPASATRCAATDRRAWRPDERALSAGPSLHRLPRRGDVAPGDRALRRADFDPAAVRAYDGGAAAPRRRVGRRSARADRERHGRPRRRRRSRSRAGAGDGWRPSPGRPTRGAAAGAGRRVHARTRRLVANEARWT